MSQVRGVKAQDEKGGLGMSHLQAWELEREKSPLLGGVVAGGWKRHGDRKAEGKEQLGYKYRMNTVGQNLSHG